MVTCLSGAESEVLPANLVRVAGVREGMFYHNLRQASAVICASFWCAGVTHVTRRYREWIGRPAMCSRCHGLGWVCELHSDEPMDRGCRTGVNVAVPATIG